MGERSYYTTTTFLVYMICDAHLLDEEHVSERSYYTTTTFLEYIICDVHLHDEERVGERPSRGRDEAQQLDFGGCQSESPLHKQPRMGCCIVWSCIVSYRIAV